MRFWIAAPCSGCNQEKDLPENIEELKHQFKIHLRYQQDRGDAGVVIGIRGGQFLGTSDILKSLNSSFNLPWH